MFRRLTAAAALLAAARGIHLGTAVTGGKPTGAYADTAAAQFDSVPPGNEMKRGSVEPVRGRYSRTGADRIVDFDEAHGQEVRGHALVKRLLAQGVPIDGVGFQAHLTLGQVTVRDTGTAPLTGRRVAWSTRPAGGSPRRGTRRSPRPAPP
ncbi:endo-1,4-beta-xylanase [Streptomyces roseolus]|uniref:endo-1,4-beta-xylanase n=1 Tax=Streptomyces roseolus TaxID=67358 RepID=UPI00365EED2F